MKPFQPNGVARFAARVRWEGVAKKHGTDPYEERVRESRVHITTKLISTHYETYDRSTGHKRHHNRGIKPVRVVAYKLDGQDDWTTVGHPVGTNPHGD